LIEYGVEEAIEAGMNGMCIVTGRGKHSLMDHFDKNYELEHQISGTSKEALLDDIRSLIDSASYTYIRQREMKGLGHAILTGRELVGDEPFAVVLADDLCVNEEQGVLAQMVELYKQFRCSIVAVQEVPETETHKYGVIAGEMIKDDIFRIDNMVEKPEPGTAPSNLAIIGRYILTPDIFELIENTEPGKVYVGNFIGAMFLLALVTAAGLYQMDAGQWGLNALNIAQHKLHHTLLQAFLSSTLGS
ncbi:UTP--glucose-1-phosphate uridylyltransferase, partial [Vibrio parahaemolyticus AQ3810]